MARGLDAMNEEALVARKTDDWRRLNALCDRAELGMGKLSGPEIVEFVRLYRKASADYAYFMTHTTNDELVEHLSRLVGRAYGQLYRRTSKPLSQAVTDAMVGAARTVREAALFTWIAFALFLLGGVFGWLVMHQDPEVKTYVVPPMMEEVFEHWKQGEHPVQEGGESVLATAGYATNNPRVALLTNALSAGTFGVAAAFILWTNGMLLGVLTSEVQSVGQTWFLYSSILPHGVTEIFGILLSGAGGLMLGWAAIRPGKKTRGQAMLEVSGKTLTLALLGVAMTLLAAPIEGFFSFDARFPQEIKFVAGLATAVLWWLFFSTYGRSAQPAEVSAPSR